jgi:very-short-patch-repair endonuclease
MTVWSKKGSIKLAHYCKRSSKARAFLEQEGIPKLHINYIEGEILDIIIDAMDGLTTCYKQYPVDGYRVDLYLKDINLVIECDEMGHEYKNDLSEIIRQKTIESKLGCKFLRFNPDKPGFKFGEILNEIFKHILQNQSRKQATTRY